jgi:hypothetical protein
MRKIEKIKNEDLVSLSQMLTLLCNKINEVIDEVETLNGYNK